MRYSLFLCDFDGTLVRADGTVSERNVRAIDRYRAAGGIFVVVTGRMPSAILPRLRELGIGEGLVVAYQGAVVCDVATGKPVKSDGFSHEDALRAVRFFEGEGVHTHVYSGDRFYSDRDDDLLARYERICGVKGEVVPDLSGLLERTKMPVVKVLAMVEPSVRERLRERAEAALGKEFFVACSSSFLVEIMPRGQSKGDALDYLARRFGIPGERVAAIGDHGNDLPMLLRAGGKFAVGNAEPELKACARVVASCEEDGVAEALEYAMGDEI